MNVMSRTTPCRACGKEIAFIKTRNGKSIPVNPESVYFIPAGGPNTYVMMDGSVKRGRSPEYDDDEKRMIGFISHFATCPAADTFRAGKKAAGKK